MADGMADREVSVVRTALTRATRPSRVGALLAGVVLAGCGAASPAADGSSGTPGVDDAASVVVTTGVLGALVDEVVGDAVAPGDVEVTVLMESGVDPHAFAPSARDAQRIGAADVVIANGLGLEAGLTDALLAAEQDGVDVVRLAERADPRPADAGLALDHAGDDHAGDDDAGDDHADDDHAGDDHADGALDPHVWLDPVRLATMAEGVAAAVAAVAPAHADTVTASGEAVAAEYDALAAELDSTLAAIPADRRALVTNHDAFGYFADRFDLEVIATVLPGATTQSEASAADVAALVELLEREGVTAVFTEATSSDRVATSVAGDVAGVDVIELYSGSLGAPGSGAETPAGMLRTNADRLVAALE